MSLALAGEGLSAESFPIFTHGAPLASSMTPSTIDSAFSMFEHLGVNIFVTPSNTALFEQVSQKSFRIILNNGLGARMANEPMSTLYNLSLQLADQKPWYVYDFAYHAAYFENDAATNDLDLGYEINAANPNKIGAIVTDPIFFHNVLYADTSTDTVGYLFPGVNGFMGNPVSHGYTGDSQRPMTVGFKARVGSMGGDDTTVIAQIIAQDDVGPDLETGDTDVVTEVMYTSDDTLLIIYHLSCVSDSPYVLDTTAET